MEPTKATSSSSAKHHPNQENLKVLLSSTGIEPATIEAASYVMFSDVGSKDSSGANGKCCFCLNGKKIRRHRKTTAGRYTKLMFTFLFRMSNRKAVWVSRKLQEETVWSALGVRRSHDETHTTCTVVLPFKLRGCWLHCWTVAPLSLMMLLLSLFLLYIQSLYLYVHIYSILNIYA